MTILLGRKDTDTNQEQRNTQESLGMEFNDKFITAASAQRWLPPVPSVVTQPYSLRAFLCLLFFPYNDTCHLGLTSWSSWEFESQIRHASHSVRAMGDL